MLLSFSQSYSQIMTIWKEKKNTFLQWNLSWYTNHSFLLFILIYQPQLPLPPLFLIPPTSPQSTPERVSPSMGIPQSLGNSVDAGHSLSVPMPSYSLPPYQAEQLLLL